MIKKETRATAETLIKMVQNAQETMQAAVANTLKEHGEPIEFDTDCGAPSIDVGCFDSNGDNTDAYVTKIWEDNGIVRANLYGYYVGDDRENVSLNDQHLGASDWAELLEYIINEIED